MGKQQDCKLNAAKTARKRPPAQALAPEVREEGETPSQAEWREVYTSGRPPAPRLGPVAARRFAGAFDRALDLTERGGLLLRVFVWLHAGRALLE